MSTPLRPSLGTEVVAGVTTFLTMSYIIVVNPGTYQGAQAPLPRRSRASLPPLASLATAPSAPWVPA